MTHTAEYTHHHAFKRDDYLIPCCWLIRVNKETTLVSRHDTGTS